MASVDQDHLQPTSWASASARPDTAHGITLLRLCTLSHTKTALIPELHTCLVQDAKSDTDSISISRQMMLIVQPSDDDAFGIEMQLRYRAGLQTKLPARLGHDTQHQTQQDVKHSSMRHEYNRTIGVSQQQILQTVLHPSSHICRALSLWRSRSERIGFPGGQRLGILMPNLIVGEPLPLSKTDLP